MPRLISIHDMTPDRYLAFDLIDILRLLPNATHDLSWHILGLGDYTSEPSKLDAFPPKFAEVDVAEESGHGGLPVTWDELLSIADSMIQIIDGVFFASLYETSLEGLRWTPNRDEVYSKSQIAIEAHDSTLWYVFAADSDMLVPIEAHFKDVRLEREF